MASKTSEELPEGIFSLLDTDLYKLTMQCCVFKYYPDVEAVYNFTNRTPDLQLTRRAVKWLQAQIDKLANITLTPAELSYLKETCPYLSAEYLDFLSTFRLQPSKQVHLSFDASTPSDSGGGEGGGGGRNEDDDDRGTLKLHTTGSWLDTILYEIPLLALISESYFKFCDRDWDHSGQLERARDKGLQLLRGGCVFSEFGSRRRRDYKTHDLVVKGLVEAKEEGERNGWKGRLTGTSNVHFAMKYGVQPVGTVAHEWFMGVAAVTGDYENANERAIGCWVEMFGEGVLGIALTDTFGTPNFLKAFKKQIPRHSGAREGAETSGEELPTYAHVFQGVRQDSGDPEMFVRTMHDFYTSVDITTPKMVVFSDSLNIELCFKYKAVAEAHGLLPSFGVGTFFTNDFMRKTTGQKSVPLNIVIKIAEAAGKPAVKISDNAGKNTGDKKTVEDVKRRLGYTEKTWADGDEKSRWGKDGDVEK